MTGADIDKILEGMTILVDTREQQTPQSASRYRAFGVPYEHKKLDFGDYSAYFRNGDFEISLEKFVCIERKYDLTELCYCFCQQRKRFRAEFERMKAAGAKLYLLVENASWEKAYKGQYRSQMTPQALVASLTAWLARYNCQIIMCQSELSGKLIREILYREGKEMMENMLT